ncbi:MAG: hypothetical protein K2U26_13410, partial [Cyclobacteriaceae bacterium]|nr:hypothetical protein [Cyclobacteriaceae bacterium]
IFARLNYFSPCGGDYEGAAQNHASPCSVRPDCQIANPAHRGFLIARSRIHSVHAPCSHPTSCSRTHPAETSGFAWAARMVTTGQRTSTHAVSLQLLGT